MNWRRLVFGVTIVTSVAAAFLIVNHTHNSNKVSSGKPGNQFNYQFSRLASSPATAKSKSSPGALASNPSPSPLKLHDSESWSKSSSSKSKSLTAVCTSSKHQYNVNGCMPSFIHWWTCRTVSHSQYNIHELYDVTLQQKLVQMCTVKI